MNYEEAYKKALERAKKWRNAPNADKIPTFANRIIEDIFPELKESEDERIRKDIKQHFLYLDDSFPDKAKWLAWLEKQKPSDAALWYLRKNHSQSEVGDFQAAMNIAVAKAYDKGRSDAITWLERQDEKNKQTAKTN